MLTFQPFSSSKTLIFHEIRELHIREVRIQTRELGKFHCIMGLITLIFKCIENAILVTEGTDAINNGGIDCDLDSGTDDTTSDETTSDAISRLLQNISMSRNTTIYVLNSFKNI